MAVVVLGDLGRSPRMQYHALALANHGAHVDLIGYAGSPLPRSVREHPRITCHQLRPLMVRDRRRWPRPLFLGYGGLRALVQASQLFAQLLRRASDCVLVQTPPAVPTLLVALIAARVRSAKFVIDWHNLTGAMLALSVGARHPSVRWVQRYERLLGRRADAHFCVSRAMQAALAARWGVPASILYDRPAGAFVPTPPERQAELFHRLRPQLCCRWDGDKRPAIVVSPTSWTSDEDFDLLLEAVAQCEEGIARHAASGRSFPQLLIIITGNGPLRALYEARISKMVAHRIHLQTLWLSPEDYPLLLGSADLGLCLHRSASGIDLPMKVADMFGAGIPVCALDYGPCLAEQVSDGVNGLLFSSAAQLADQLDRLFQAFPQHTPLLDRLRHGVRSQGHRRWSDEWVAAAQPVFDHLLTSPSGPSPLP